MPVPRRTRPPLRARARGPWGGRAWALAATLAASVARAQGSDVRVDVEDGGGCVDGAAFEARLAKHGVAVRHGEGGDGAVASVRIVTGDGGSEGTLVLRRAAGSTTRVVHASSCEEVADALAFTLALALERPPEEAPAPPPPPPPTPPTSTPPTPAPSAPTAGSVVERPAPVAPATAPLRLELGAAVIGGGATGPAPYVGPSLGGWVLVGVRTSSRWFVPSVRLGPSLVLPTTTSEAGSLVTFAFQGGALDLCPARFGSPALAVRPCVRGLLGRSQVKSEGFSGARLDDRLYGAVGVVADGELHVVGPLLVVLSIGASTPLERATYLLGDFHAFTTPVLALSATVGAGVHFP